MPNLTIIPSPMGSQLTGAADSQNPSKWDFDVYIVADGNGSGLEMFDVSVSSGSIISLEGSHSVYKAVVRPPATAAVITFTVNANAFVEGNPQTRQNIRVSTSFPDADAEDLTLLFSHGLTGNSRTGIAVTPQHILILQTQTNFRYSTGRMTLTSFTHAGVAVSGGSINSRAVTTGVRTLDFINGDILVGGTVPPYRSDQAKRYNLSFEAQALPSVEIAQITHTRLGITGIQENHKIRVYPYGDTTPIDYDTTGYASRTVSRIAHQSDLLYVPNNGNDDFYILEINTEDEIRFLKQINVDISGANSVNDLFIYGDTLFTLHSENVRTLDIRKYRPLAKNTKTTIYPIFSNEGDTIDLKQFAPDAERFTFAVGFDKPPYLSINASNELVVGSGGNTVLVKLTAINRIDAIDLEFYLVILQAAAPVWRKVSSLTMPAGSRYDLFQIVPDADSIEFRSGRTRLAGSSLRNGVFTVGTVGGAAHFTARKGSQNSHIEIQIDVTQASNPSNFSDTFRHHVEIAGIDVTADVSVFPTVSVSLDAVTLNNYKPNEVVLTLKSNNTNGFKYNDGVPNNFWESNSLNPAGFKEPIKIFIESLVGERYISHLLFSGSILKMVGSIGDASVQLTCIDESVSLEETLVDDFGTLEKYDMLRRQSDESNIEGQYVPEASLLPMQIASSEAWDDRTKINIRRLALPCEGPTLPNTGHLTPSQFLTSGGYRKNSPLLKFKTQYRSEDVLFFISQVALNKTIYNAEIDLPAVELDNPFILNRGSGAFSVEKTRNTRILTDWVYDATDKRILMLLSNPERHIPDQLVQYSLNSDAHRVLYEFDKDVVVHRIERRNSTNYYILSSKPITQDRSVRTLPRQVDSVGYGYDAAAEGSEIKIWHYSTSSGILTELIGENNARPPQLGIHYYVGFENPRYIDEFEGIVANYRGPFKWRGSHLYYRYATDSEFGVARVNASGTTAEMIDQAKGDYWNHLNFAFDINSGGTIYFVYAEGEAHTSTLTIKRRTSNGTETTLLADTKAIGEGIYLGAYEALFHNNHLYILAPIGEVDLGEDATNTAADPDFIIEIEDTGMSGERFVTTTTNLNPTSTRLAPGDDIPIRIDFNGSVSGAQRNHLSARGGTIQSFSISSDMIDITVRPDDPTRHWNIVIDLARNAVTQRNEKTRIVVDFGTKRSRTKSAGMVLYRCNVTAANPSLTELERYDFAHLGACNLTIHDGNVHFVEHPPAGTRFRPINPDLDGYWTDNERTETMGYNLLPENQGQLKRVSSAGEVESLGNLWYTDRPYNVAVTRCLSIGSDLHLTMAYGNLDEILRVNSPASKADNVQHLVYTKKLRYVLPYLDTNSNRYAILADIAKKVNATLSFENGLIVIRDRNPYQAKTNGTTGIGSGNLSFDSTNKTFPSSGYLLIGKEILKYMGIRNGMFTSIERGILNTQITNHTNNSPILYLDNILEADRISGRFIFSTDNTRIFNIIRNADGTAEERDEASIAKYGERPYTLNLGLTKHELAWQEHILKNYLEHLKGPRQIINLTLKPTNYLQVGQIIGFKYEMLVYAVKILVVTKSKKSTQIRCRTVGV